MFSTDKPIFNETEDLLNRATFSKQLASAITSYISKDNFTIGLCGEWGCGKTSILNMVIKEIEKTTRESQEKPIIVPFNPWNYSDCNQLLSQFFSTLLTKLKESDNSEKLKAVGTALEKYSSALEYTAYIPVVGTYLAPLKSLFSELGKHAKEISDSKDDVSNKKNFVIETLEKQKLKIIVVIDDIDRLNNEQIRLIFQLVNSVAGFPNMIYLLAFDKAIVVRALEREQNFNGEEYLEKIIQVPFDVPVAKKSAIHAIFFNNLDNLFESDPCGDFDKTYWNYVFNNCIMHHLTSIRDVNRIVNVFKFKYQLMREETNWIDLLAINTLQICAPKIATWIFQNCSKLCGSVQNAGGISGVEQKENHRKYLEQFTIIYPSNPDLMMKTIQTIFPAFGWITGDYWHDNDTSEELKQKQRIASGDRFDRYFNLSLEDITITTSEIKSTIFEMNDTALRQYIDGIKNKNILKNYLTELQCYVSMIPYEKLGLFINILVHLRFDQEMKPDDNLSLVNPSLQAMSCILAILKRMDEQDRFELLSELTDICGIDNIEVIVHIINDCETGWGRFGDRIYEEYQYVTEDHLDTLEKKIFNRIFRMSKESNLLDYEFFRSLIPIWYRLDRASYTEYLKTQLKTAVNIPKYLSIVAGKASVWSSTYSSGWTFNESSFTNDITREDAYAKICELKGSPEFNALNTHHKKICIAFYLWNNLDGKEDKVITDKEVTSLLPSWEVPKSV